MTGLGVAFVIPTLNEADGIRSSIEGIPKRELEALGFPVKILVVDGNSPDGTAAIARSLGAEVVSEPRPGYGRALKTGLEKADADVVVTADGDGTYPLDRITELVQLLVDKDLDLVIANRFPFLRKGAMPFRNWVGNQVLGIVARLLFGIRVRDLESGMWVVRKRILEHLVLGSDRWPFSHEFKIEAICYARCRWAEVPIEYQVRLGRSKLPGWQAGFEDLLHLVRKRLNRHAR